MSEPQAKQTELVILEASRAHPTTHHYEVMVPFLDAATGSGDAVVYEVWATDDVHATAFARERFRDYQVKHPRAYVTGSGPEVLCVHDEPHAPLPATRTTVTVRLSPGAHAALEVLRAQIQQRLAGRDVPEVPLSEVASYVLERVLVPGSRRLPGS